MAKDAVAIGLSVFAVVLLHVGAPDITIIPIFAAIILALLLNEGLPSQLLNTAMFVWLGNISYSLYLIHGLFQFGATAILNGAGIHDPTTLSARISLILLGFMIGFCLLSATFTYYTVEVTGRRYLRKFFQISRRPLRIKRQQSVRSTASAA